MIERRICRLIQALLVEIDKTITDTEKWIIALGVDVRGAQKIFEETFDGREKR